jgi:alcohol dehydrogenase (cytochrome c)
VRSKLRHLGLAAVFAVVPGTASAAGSSKPAVYTSAQAQQGATIFSKHCASCHGAQLQGGAGPALKGKSFEQLADSQDLNGATLLAFISQHMPLTNPGSLDKTQYDDVAAYILKENGFPAGNTKLTPNTPKLKTVKFAPASSSGSSPSSSSSSGHLSSKY